MGLQKIIKKHKAKEKEIRFLILGLDNAGKTTIVKKLKGEDLNKISPTLGFNIETLEFGGLNLNIWDIGGQTSLRAYWKNYFEETDGKIIILANFWLIVGLVWVVDSNDKMRLNDCKKELFSILKQEKLAGATLLIYCNKQDVDGALSPDEIKQFLELDTITTRHWGVIPCSAMTGLGVFEGIDWLVSDISKRIYTFD